MTRLFIVLAALLLPALDIHSQELEAKININHSKIQGTDASVFENLKQTLEQFVNERQWTELQFQPNERISCNFNITVDKYVQAENRFECSATIQATRPVYNSAYTTTIYNNTDKQFTFTFLQFDQLTFDDETVQNQLTALMAYYAYLIIGIDLDTFSPLGGTDVLQRCMYLVNNAQDLGYPGWKSFEDSRNRFAIINDYLDEPFKPFRQHNFIQASIAIKSFFVPAIQNIARGSPIIRSPLFKRFPNHLGNRMLIRGDFNVVNSFDLRKFFGLRIIFRESHFSPEPNILICFIGPVAVRIIP